MNVATRTLRNLLLAALVGVLAVASASAQDSEPTRDLEHALRTGASAEIVRQTHRSLDLVLLGSGGMFSASQAGLVLSEFFNTYPPSRLELSPGLRNGSTKTASGLYWSQRLAEPVGVFARYRLEERGWVLVALHLAAPGSLR